MIFAHLSVNSQPNLIQILEVIFTSGAASIVIFDLKKIYLVDIKGYSI